MKRFCVLALIITAVSAGGVVRSADTAQGNAACSRLARGLDFKKDRNFVAALDDFQVVINSCDQPSTRAEALLNRGHIFLEQWPRQFNDARAAAKELTTSPAYLNTQWAGKSHILKGRIEIEDTRNFQAAMDEFQRVAPGIQARTDDFAEALYWTGETYRLNHQPKEARAVFLSATLKYPETIWAARALLGSASCQVELGFVAEAMETLQRVRRLFPGSEEARTALVRNTLLYRLLHSPSVFTPTQILTSKSRFNNGVALAVGDSDQLLVAHKAGLTLVKADTGEVISTPQMSARVDGDVTAAGSGHGMNALAYGFVLVFDRPAKTFEPGMPRPEDKPEYLKILSFVSNWRGEWILGDGNSNSVARFTPDQPTQPVFVARNLKPIRMTQNNIDDVAVLDGDSKAVLVFDRAGKALGQIPRRSPSDRQYQMESPSDVAFDDLGNYYVLDSDKAAILVFDPRRTYQTTIQLPQKGPEALKKPVALAIDRTGRIHVLDRDRQLVISYR